MKALPGLRDKVIELLQLVSLGTDLVWDAARSVEIECLINLFLLLLQPDVFELADLPLLEDGNDLIDLVFVGQHNLAHLVQQGFQLRNHFHHLLGFLRALHQLGFRVDLEDLQQLRQNLLLVLQLLLHSLQILAGAARGLRVFVPRRVRPRAAGLGGRQLRGRLLLCHRLLLFWWVVVLRLQGLPAPLLRGQLLIGQAVRGSVCLVGVLLEGPLLFQLLAQVLHFDV